MRKKDVASHMELVEIHEAAREKEIRNFMGLAHRVYSGDEVWVQESGDRLSRAFRGSRKVMAVIAIDDNGRPTARAAAFLSPGDTRGCIGLFEALKDHEREVGAVLSRCEDWLREQGASSVIAPRSDELFVGLQVSGFEMDQTISTPHNPPYYRAYLEDNGYRKLTTLMTYLFRAERVEIPEVEVEGYRVREFEREELDREIGIFHTLNHSIFGSSIGYTHRSLEEDRALIMGFMPVVDDSLVLFIEDRDAKPVGMLLCLPDINRLLKGGHVTTARIISIGLIPGQGGKGLGTMLVARLIRNLKRKGYTTAEASWILEDNPAPHALAGRFDPEPGREFILYTKELASREEG